MIDEGYQGKYTVVKDTVRELKRTMCEVYVPLIHRPGEAQVDYFEASVLIVGVQRKVKIFMMALAYSDAFS